MLETLMSWTKPPSRDLEAIRKSLLKSSLFLSLALVFLPSCGPGESKKATKGTSHTLGTNVSSNNCGNNRSISFFRKGAVRTTAQAQASGEYSIGIESLSNHSGDIGIKSIFTPSSNCGNVIIGPVTFTCEKATLGLSSSTTKALICSTGNVQFYYNNDKGVKTLVKKSLTAPAEIYASKSSGSGTITLSKIIFDNPKPITPPTGVYNPYPYSPLQWQQPWGYLNPSTQFDPSKCMLNEQWPCAWR